MQSSTPNSATCAVPPDPRRLLFPSMEQLIPAMSDEAAAVMSRHTLSLAIKARRSDTPWVKAERGSFALVNAGTRDVFVTCFHVLEALREAWEKDPSALMVAYSAMEHHGRTMLAEYNTFELIDESKSLDVAIFRGLLDRILIFDLPDRELIDYRASYLEDPKAGEPVMIVGYPGANVSLSPELADLGYMQIGYTASSVSDRYVVLANESGTRKFSDYSVPSRQGVSLGGLSGSPAFVLREQRPRFIGIVSESGDTGTTDDTIFVSRLGCLKPDGTLDHLRIPA
jgi:hypothetical protein